VGRCNEKGTRVEDGIASKKKRGIVKECGNVKKQCSIQKNLGGQMELRKYRLHPGKGKVNNRDDKRGEADKTQDQIFLSAVETSRLLKNGWNMWNFCCLNS